MSVNMFKNFLSDRPRRVTHTLPEKAPILGGSLKASKPPAAAASKKRPCSACGKGRSW